MKKMKNYLVHVFRSHSKAYWCVLFFGCFLRLFYLGNIPGNSAVFADEAVSAYDAFSLLHYGYDMNGYHMPVYLVSWGDGTSIMQPYLMMPFIAFMGLSSLSIRLPQAILGCLSIPIFYYVAKEIRKDDNFAVFAMFVFAVMPWHIMMSRWALDCNMIVYFMIFATAVLIKSTENRRFLPLSAVLFGSCLYCYALPWIVMPLIVLGSVLYLIKQNYLTVDKYLFISALIFAVFALPLLVFLLVNGGVIDEIKTVFISIPRIPNYRSGELSLNPKQMLINFSNSLDLFIKQDDGRVSDATPIFGLYYKFSGIPILIGMAMSIYTFIARKNDYPLEILMWIQLLAGILLGCIMNDIVFSRINIIHVPITWFLATGLYSIISFFGKEGKWCAIFIYCLSVCAFFVYYVSIHDQKVAEVYGDGMKYAMEEVTSEDNRGLNVHVLSGINYGLFLYYTSFPTDVFVNTVEYKVIDDPEPDPLKCEGVDFSGDKELDPCPALYVCGTDDSESLEFMRVNQMDIKTYTSLAVGKWTGQKDNCVH